ALDSKFNSRGIKLAVAISTLVVSTFYLIPQMVGAGSLVQPLLGLEYKWGVLLVGLTVTIIVVTAGMVSTTWVQFIKGSLLVLFCLILTVLILRRGLQARPDFRLQGSREGFPIGTITRLPDGRERTGPLSPLKYISTFQRSDVAILSKTGSATLPP